MRSIPTSSAIEYNIRSGSRDLSFREVIQLWRTSGTFRDFYLALLVNVTFSAIFWETPAMTRATLDQRYRFVCVHAPSLARISEDRYTFSEHFQRGTPGGVVTFGNLGGDSKLIAPVPAEGRDFAHLASFVRSAEREQAHELLRSMAVEVERTLDDRPLWLSTSGLGVFYLHIRLDRRPKYYTYAPYRERPVITDVVPLSECEASVPGL